MTDIEPFYIIGGIIGGLTQVLMLVMCIILVLKNKNTGTLLMLIGSILTILFYGLNIAWTTIAARNGAESVANSVAILQLLANIPYVIFTIGFGVFVFNHTRKQS
jgi:uncharacterized membrane protein